MAVFESISKPTSQISIFQFFKHSFDGEIHYQNQNQTQNTMDIFRATCQGTELNSNVNLVSFCFSRANNSIRFESHSESHIRISSQWSCPNCAIKLLKQFKRISSWQSTELIEISVVFTMSRLIRFHLKTSRLIRSYFRSKGQSVAWLG